MGNTPTSIVEYAERQNRLLIAAWKTASEATMFAQEQYTADAYTTTNTTTKFAIGDRVCYQLFDNQRKLYSSWFGPCHVEAVQEHGNYILQDLPNNTLANKFHISQLRAYYATLPEDILASDEYIVDKLLDRRTRGALVQYQVKWRQYGNAISQAAWEPRGELLRRCADLVEAYDKANLPPPIPRSAEQCRSPTTTSMHAASPTRQSVRS